MIESDRLILRAWSEADAPALFKYASEPRVSELALWPCHTSVEMSRWVIENIFKPNPHNYAIVLKATDEPIGCIGLVPAGSEHYPTANNEREVGYWIGLPLWNLGLTTEALEALMAYSDSELRLSSLLITTDADNIASQRVAEKCGFAFLSEFTFDGTPSKAYRRIFNKIEPCNPTDYESLSEIWERSVRATHQFLTEKDISEIKQALIPDYFPNVDLYKLISGGLTVGFIGLADKKIEMLFIDNKQRGKGYGSALIDFAIVKGINEVDVNEQNPSALAFYKSKGFKIVGRDETDDAGRLFPILHLSR